PATLITLDWSRLPRGCDSQEPHQYLSSDGVSLSRSYFAEKLQRTERVGTWEAAGARRVLPNLSRAEDSGWRSGAQLSGTSSVFQCEEERFASADFRSGKQGRG